MPNKERDTPTNDSRQQSPTQLAYGDCPTCASPLQLKHVGKSTFLGCTAYPKCDYSHSLNQQEVVTLKVIDDSKCPKCASMLAVKKGRYGMFIGCTDFPACDFISTSQQTKHDDKYEPVICPNCKNGQLQKKKNRFGKFFYPCDAYPQCKYVENLEPVKKECPKCKSNIMLINIKQDNTFVCANQQCGHTVAE